MKKVCYYENLSNTQREKFLLLDEEGKKVRFAESRNDIKGLQEVYRESSVALAFYSNKQQLGESEYYTASFFVGTNTLTPLF